MSKLDPYRVAQAINALDVAEKVANEATQAHVEALRAYEEARQELRLVLGVTWGPEFGAAMRIARELLGL